MEHKSNTALLVMDMQPAIVDSLAEAPALLHHVQSAIAHARKKQLLICFVVVGFRPGTPEVSTNNKRFSLMARRQPWTTEVAETWQQVHPVLAPRPEDILIVKRRVSAFTGSDLEVVLRAQGIHHLVLSGVATSGVVLSTLREAADKDYQLTVLADCCADRDEEVHRVLTTKVFPKQADTLPLTDWISQVEPH